MSVTDEEIRECGGDDAVIIDMRREDNKYLHRDFHLLGDNALKYCAEKYGREAVIEFLRDFTDRYFAPVVEEVKRGGLSALRSWLLHVYEIEEAADLIETELSEDRLTVRIKHSPVIEYMRTLGQEPSEYYIEETRTVYGRLAELSGYTFTLSSYNEDGAAEFTFKA